MRIWFDISNSPHVLLFHALIKDLQSNGHEIIITTRPLANTIDLLDQSGLKYVVIGKHYGKSMLNKLLGFPIRVIQLYCFLRNNKIQLAVGQSSFHLPLVSKLLFIPSIYMNDNEHAAGNIIGFYCAKKILVPQHFILNKYLNFKWIKSKITYYPGVKEGIYLWVKHRRLEFKRSQFQSNDIRIYIRPEPQTAQYYSGALFFLDDIIDQLQKIYKITILTRNQSQFDHYAHNRFKYCYVPSKPISFEDIALDCTLFIGAGGSMTREFALLGIPTISVYQDKLLAVDHLLLQEQLLFHCPSLNHEIILKILETSNFRKRNNALLDFGKQAYGILKSEIVKHSAN